MNKAYLLIGGNMGNREENLKKAIEKIGRLNPIVQVSAVYETAAWGKTDQEAFLNQAIEIDTALSPAALLKEALDIEKQLGRKRELHYGPRTIDIDIIFYNDAIINQPDLKIPHPAMAFRRFVLQPLADIAPNYIHPILHKSVTMLLAGCEDPLPVSDYNK